MLKISIKHWGHTKLTFTCSKLTIEKLEKGVEYVHKKTPKLTKNLQNDVNDVVLVFLLLRLNIFYTFF